MNTKALFSAAALALVITTPAAAVDGNGGLTAKIGTLGIGLEYDQPINDYLSLRAGGNLLNWNFDQEVNDVDYDATFKFKSVSLLADWHPFANGFRLTGGAMYNGNKVDVTAEPKNGSYTINGTKYSASMIDSLSGDIKFSSFAPYLGLGWGVDPTARSHWSFSFDLGVLFQGDADPNLSGTCAPGVPAPVCAQFQQNVAAEERDLEDDMDGYSLYPVLSVGVTYSF